MSFRWQIHKNMAGEYVAAFLYNEETIWHTEGYRSLSSAKSAIASILKNSSSAQIEDNIPDGTADELDLFRNAIIPAADRLVAPDHNSREYRDFDETHKRLSQMLLQANDLREFETKELMVARKELDVIGSEVREPSFRAEHLWTIAKSTFLWIAEKAADGVIKALAVAALFGLAALLGIQLPVH